MRRLYLEDYQYSEIRWWPIQFNIIYIQGDNIDRSFQYGTQIWSRTIKIAMHQFFYVSSGLSFNSDDEVTRTIGHQLG